MGFSKLFNYTRKMMIYICNNEYTSIMPIIKFIVNIFGVGTGTGASVAEPVHF